jgi:hypothetical protein
MNIRNLLLVFLLTLFQNTGAQIHINEFLASNQSGITDEDGDFEDWIEIYNSHSIPISLSNWYISDNDNDRRKWQFPANLIIQPGEFLLVWASGKDRQSSLHTNFRISSSGEPIILSNADGNIIDRIPPAVLQPDQSFGRVPDGGAVLETFHTPTPGSSNLINGQAPIAVSLLFSHPSGFYPDTFSLEIHSTRPAEIRYTLDGSDPDSAGVVYQMPISVTDRVGDTNTISNIRAGVDHHWLPPKGEVAKIVVVRAKAYQNGHSVGAEIWGSWWTGHHNPDNVSIPIISLLVNPDDFFDYERGIYIPGIDWDSLGRENSWRRGREHEVPVRFTYFDENGDQQLSQGAGARIHGGATRRAGQKTLRLYARSEYGDNTFNYPFFSERDHSNYRRLLLQTTYGDFAKSIMKDELTTRLIYPLGIEVLHFRPVLVFLNGEYWALHFLKERRDNHYLSAISGVDADSINHLRFQYDVVSGSADDYVQMLAFIENEDPEREGLLDEINEMMDVQNYIDYMVCQIFLANTDWPHNNIDFWKPDTLGARWRWIFYDLDASMRLYELDNLSTYFEDFDPLKEENAWPRHFLRLMLKIPEFKDRFRNRFYSLMETTLSSENMLQEISKLRAEIQPYANDYIYRWRIPRSTTEWEDNISILNSFASRRPAFMKDLLKRSLGTPFHLYPNPAHDEVYLEERNGNIEGFRDLFIFDLMGRALSVPYVFENGRIKFDVSNLPSGTYQVKILRSNVYSTLPLIVVRP